MPSSHLQRCAQQVRGGLQGQEPKGREGHGYQVAPDRSTTAADAAEGHKVAHDGSNAIPDHAEGYRLAQDRSNKTPRDIGVVGARQPIEVCVPKISSLLMT